MLAEVSRLAWCSCSWCPAAGGGVQHPDRRRGRGRKPAAVGPDRWRCCRQWPEPGGRSAVRAAGGADARDVPAAGVGAARKAGEQGIFRLWSAAYTQTAPPLSRLPALTGNLPVVPFKLPFFSTCASVQAHERRESDLQELQAQVAASELLLSQVRAESSAALLALREQLSEAHEQDRELLMRELRELQVGPMEGWR